MRKKRYQYLEQSLCPSLCPARKKDGISKSPNEQRAHWLKEHLWLIAERLKAEVTIYQKHDSLRQLDNWKQATKEYMLVSKRKHSWPSNYSIEEFLYIEIGLILNLFRSLFFFQNLNFIFLNLHHSCYYPTCLLKITGFPCKETVSPTWYSYNCFLIGK